MTNEIIVHEAAAAAAAERRTIIVNHCDTPVYERGTVACATPTVNEDEEDEQHLRPRNLTSIFDAMPDCQVCQRACNDVVECGNGHGICRSFLSIFQGRHREAMYLAQRGQMDVLELCRSYGPPRCGVCNKQFPNVVCSVV